MTAHDSADRVLEAERYTLACMMGAPGAVETAAEIIAPRDFLDPGNGAIYGALVAMFAGTEPVTVPTLGAWLDRNGITGYHGRDYLQALHDLPATADMVEAHARIVWEASVRRQVSAEARQMHLAASDPAATPDQIIGRAQEGLNLLAAAATADHTGLQGIAAFLGRGAEIVHVPCIPGLLWKMDRVVVVGGEGDGKSWLAWQVAFAGAAGVHPFTGQPIPPIRVLIVELETPPAIFADGLARQHAIASRQPEWQDSRISLWHKPGGINLELPTDALLLAEQIRLAKPDLVIAGPIYKMIEEGEHTDHQHRVAARFWDKMRERYGFALWLETHAPMQGAGAKGGRLMRPRGSGVWAQWGEMGISLLRTKIAGELELGRYRGDRGAASRCWPTHVQRSILPQPSWPWTARYPTGTLLDPEQQYGGAA